MPTQNDSIQPLLNGGKAQEAAPDQGPLLSEAPQILSPELKTQIHQLLYERKTEQALALCVGLGDQYLLLQAQLNAAKSQSDTDLLASEYFEATKSRINYTLQELMEQKMEPTFKNTWKSSIFRVFIYIYRATI